jgi:hypothetical protein
MREETSPCIYHTAILDMIGLFVIGRDSTHSGCDRDQLIVLQYFYRTYLEHVHAKGRFAV